MSGLKGNPTRALLLPGTAACVTRCSPSSVRALGTSHAATTPEGLVEKGPPASAEASGSQKHLLHSTLFGD